MPVIDVRVKNGNPGMIVVRLPMCKVHKWRKTLIMPRRTETGGKLYGE